ncbi:MAG: DUF1565 domain-containing protein [Candidatus Cloacimonetes bacterium]|nr:DUF1565 domain-containing protein [Candidatus Cloacimonadota bacterium]
MRVLAFFFIVLCIPIMLCCDILEVDIAGNYEYQIIQEAINASATGDTVLVHPGRYYENINLNGHNITLTSLYIQEPLQTYIDSTIIDGNYQGSCLIIENGETARVNGFTLINNENGLSVFWDDYSWFAGGGIYIKLESNVTLSNCTVRNCFSTWGGGVAVSQAANCLIRNVDIYQNQAMICGGGLYVNAAAANLDNSDQCSIYNNISSTGMDIFFNENPEIVELYLETGSMICSEPDYFYIAEQNSPDVIIECQNSFFSTVNQDIYVAPWGDDSFSGTNPGTPLKSIVYALQIIESDSLNPKTIHLAEGTYSNSENGQIYPCAVKSDIKMQGEDIENTILDGELLNSIFSIYYQKNIYLSDIKIIDCRYSGVYGAIACWGSRDIRYNNFIIENCICNDFCGLTTHTSENVIIENVVIQNTESAYYDLICFIDLLSSITFNNIIANNLSITHNDSSDLGFVLNYSDARFRNSIISNFFSHEGKLFRYLNDNEIAAENTLEFSNVLVINNELHQTSVNNSLISMENHFQPVYISNCTFANNQSFHRFFLTSGLVEFYNNIFYNLEIFDQLYMNNEINFVPCEVVLKNNLLGGGMYIASNWDYVIAEDNLWHYFPEFYGEDDPYINEGMPDYYQLSENSPCIDAGTPDTLGLHIPSIDLAGNQRVWNGIIDMGCYEWNPDVENEEELIIDIGQWMIRNYPNPVYLKNERGIVFLEFTLPEIPVINPIINIYNLRGQKVKSIQLTQSLSGLARIAGLATSETQRGEAYSIVWDCRNDSGKTVSSGVYFYTLSVDDQVLGANKLLILR